MAENTVVIFASDARNIKFINLDTFNAFPPIKNGGHICEGASNYPLRGMKWQVWEGGIHVPALVHNPLNPASQGKTFHG